MALLPPPYAPVDTLLQSRLDSLAPPDVRDAFEDPSWPHDEQMTYRNFQAWADDFSTRWGHGKVLWGVSRRRGEEPRTTYYVQFRDGIHTVRVLQLDEDAYMIEQIDGRDLPQ